MDKHLCFLTNINDNRLLDIIGFEDQQNLSLPTFATTIDDNGWCVPKHPWFVADMTGDSKLNLVGFEDDRVFVVFNSGDGTFQSTHKVSNDFC